MSFGDGTTNRVLLDKPLSLRSVNGAQFTTISGGGLRCAYVANGATLSGFTLAGGSAAVGAGLCCESLNVVVSNCVLVANRAGDRGGEPLPAR